jgi:hypothetical protein
MSTLSPTDLGVQIVSGAAIPDPPEKVSPLFCDVIIF